MKKRLLFISPHYSTGGSCQFTLNKVELLLPHYNIVVVEYDYISPDFVVQREKMIELIGEDRFFSLGVNKKVSLEQIVTHFKPHIVSMEEFPEMFMDRETAEYLYFNSNRDYKIFESTHDSSFSPHNKFYKPDEFVFVSAFTALRYIQFDIPTHIVEYPIDVYELKLKNLNKHELQLSEDANHVVIVGLFTERKNQGYAFEIARKLQNRNIQFHFIGNQAGNFASYWQPLMKNKPDNCIIHGEKKNVKDYLRAADLFLFPSKGERNNKELNPLVIKEAQMVKKLPKLIFNLDVYLNKYNGVEDFHFLTGDVDIDAQKVLELINPVEKENESYKEKEAIIIGTYPNLESRKKLTKECIQSLKPLGRKIILISHYPVDEEIQSMVDYYIFDKDNPLTHHSYYKLFHNETDEYYAKININGLKDSNQSFTVYTNLRNAMAFAQENGFKSAFYITYDVIVHPDDLMTIEQSFASVKGFYKAHLSTLNTPFGKGIQTNGMTFDTGYYTAEFPRLKNADEYNTLCSKIGAENFLEDFLMKHLERLNSFDHKILDYKEETFLRKSGLGASSNSEYYSILPIEGSDNEFMFYFYTYNIDERKILVSFSETYSSSNTQTASTHLVDVAKNREFKWQFKYKGDEIKVELVFRDTNGRNYKREVFLINDSTIEKYQHTGIFRWKKKEEPKKESKHKIKLVHLQTTINDEREQKSREQLEKVQAYNWEYINYNNVPYKELPPAFNCSRPDCVSLHLFDEETVQRIGTSLTPAHYGCYLAFKNAITESINSDYDYLIVCEGDCKVEVPMDEFIEKVESVCSIIKNTDIGYVSFGDSKTLEHGWLQSPVVKELPDQNLIYITDHIIGLQCIMFPKKVIKWLIYKLINEKWDAADMYFNAIFYNSQYKMAIVKKRLTSQFDGYSLIDKTEKKFN